MPTMQLKKVPKKGARLKPRGTLSKNFTYIFIGLSNAYTMRDFPLILVSVNGGEAKDFASDHFFDRDKDFKRKYTRKCICGRKRKRKR